MSRIKHPRRAAAAPPRVLLAHGEPPDPPAPATAPATKGNAMTAAEILNAYEQAGAAITPSLEFFAGALAETFSRAAGTPDAYGRQQLMVSDLARAAARRYVPPPAPPRATQLSQFGTQTAIVDGEAARPMNPDE